jgi:eukaryotic-like serine/threonine-protein kinase
MSVSPGTRLGPYEVIARIGAGGMGEVYKARDARLDRTVAIKVLPTEIAGDPDLRSRFEREARAVAALEHPHICGIYDTGSVDGTPYLVMPLLDGQTLAARLEKGALPLTRR